MNRKLDGIEYSILESEDDIRKYVLAICEEEWSLDDFDEYGPELYDQTWQLKQVPLGNILPQKQLLASKEFIADVTPRIAKQRELKERGIPIPPLILRGSDYLIFDGYARWHFFNEINVKTCLAYVSI